jgi:Sodium:solute symporter family
LSSRELSVLLPWSRPCLPGVRGRLGHIFGVAPAQLKTVNPATGKPYGSIVVLPAGEWSYATLALGSALALFVYPHPATGVFAAKRRDVIRRNAAMLPAYTLVLGLIALFGYMARAAPGVNVGIKATGGNSQLSVPLLFEHMFPTWFAGIGDSAIVIGALVPAAVMSIAAANLFTRTIYRELLRPYATPAEETRVARLVSLVMKVGALGFALELNKTFSINLQLLGGIWILQTFPAVVIGLYTRWFHRFALIIGWAVGTIYGTVQAYRTPGGGQAHFGSSAAPVFGHVTYIAITALILNLVVAAALTPVFRKIGLQDGYDETRPADYVADPVTRPAARGAGTPDRPAEPVAGSRVVFAPGNGQVTSQRPTATGPPARHRRHRPIDDGQTGPNGSGTRRPYLCTMAAVRRDLRSTTTPTTLSSNPAARVASQGAESGAVSRGAVPPRPVPAPPIGAIGLAAASVRLSISSPDEPSSTTMVWTEPAARVTDIAVCAPPAEVNCTFCTPGWTAMYCVTAPKASC